MIVDSRTLHGWSYEAAKCMGMPHFMARYTSGDYRKYKKDQDAECMVCGRPATDVHHQPFREYFELRTGWGTFVLKPALITLCRECHEKVEHSEISIKWEWDSDEYEERWWNGDLLAHCFNAHSKALSELGGWHVEIEG